MAIKGQRQSGRERAQKNRLSSKGVSETRIFRVVFAASIHPKFEENKANMMMIMNARNLLSSLAVHLHLVDVVVQLL